jgi:long-chain acyl-CoA synthetase
MGREEPHRLHDLQRPVAGKDEVYALLRRRWRSGQRPLPAAQRIARFLLLYKELDADDGELTRTRKVRRGVINEKYGDIIEAVYAGAPAVPVDTTITFQDGTKQRIRTTLRVIDLDRDAPGGARRAA